MKVGRRLPVENCNVSFAAAVFSPIRAKANELMVDSIFKLVWLELIFPIKRIIKNAFDYFPRTIQINWSKFHSTISKSASDESKIILSFFLPTLLRIWTCYFLILSNILWRQKAIGSIQKLVSEGLGYKSSEPNWPKND